VTIYVGPLVRDGFVEVDKGVFDSIKDIRGELRWEKRALRVVDDADAADLKLYVVKRSVATGPKTIVGSMVGGVGSVVSIPDKIKRLETLLRTSTYEREFVAERGGWAKLARRIAEDVSVWLTANRERVASKP
jgi:hypothetical protein